MIGILAFGSLRNDAGLEIKSATSNRLVVQTPFAVEYARYSKSRGGGPTLVPVPSGNSVNAVILVLADGVSITEAQNMLWRRETRSNDRSAQYVEDRNPGPDAVLPLISTAYDEFDGVVYTDFPKDGKVSKPDPVQLARKAIDSVRVADEGKDGLTYLIERMSEGTRTRLTPEYKKAILDLTKCDSLEKALYAQRVDRA